VLRNESFSPRAFSEAVGAALVARSSNNALVADIKIAGDLPVTVLGDVLRLRAALENLADNAVKFTDVGSVLFTADVERATQKRVRLVFTFSDSGIGMSGGELKQLFRPFAQGSAEIARRLAGPGLAFFSRRQSDGRRLGVTSKRPWLDIRLTVLVESADLHSTSERTQARPHRLVHCPFFALRQPLWTRRDEYNLREPVIASISWRRGGGA
jgi:hypothetical protein